MQLKNAASLLMIGSIALIAVQFLTLFYFGYMGMIFLGGFAIGVSSAVVSCLGGVIGLYLGISFRRGTRHSIGRMMAGIFLAIVAGLWIIVELAGAFELLDYLLYADGFVRIILLSRLMSLMFSLSLMLFGIALAGTNRLRQRRAYMWLIVCGSLWGLFSLGITGYTLSQQSLGTMLIVMEIAQILSVSFCAGFVWIALVLRQIPEANQLEAVQTEEF